VKKLLWTIAPVGLVCLFMWAFDEGNRELMLGSYWASIIVFGLTGMERGSGKFRT
jgi:hypothetical protein